MSGSSPTIPSLEEKKLQTQFLSTYNLHWPSLHKPNQGIFKPTTYIRRIKLQCQKPLRTKFRCSCILSVILIRIVVSSKLYSKSLY